MAERRYDLRTFGADFAAAAAVAALAIPQGIAYALIAGLPPAMGLYAASAPAIAAGFFRSSRHVVAGPTNALSLLVGGSVAGIAASEGADPAAIAVALAFWVGIVQVAAGFLRIGIAVGYISSAVVAGYITAAATLIVYGQVPNLSGATELGFGLATAAAMVLLQRLAAWVPAALLAIAGATLAAALFAPGLARIGDLAAVPAGLPPLTIPFEMPIATHMAILSAAVAAAVLSLVESDAAGRGLARASGERVDKDREIAGQGVANLAASFAGAYPVSGSLARSMLNFRAGARTRAAGVLSGVLILAVVPLGAPAIDGIPIAGLAGMLLVLAWDLVDLRTIRRTLRGSLGDAAAFAVTFLGAWTLRLDFAIYLGVAVSLVLFLRRARMLVVRELQVDVDGHLREVEGRSCRVVRVLHAEGPLFFGAAAELQHALDEALAEEKLRILVVRLKRTQGMDLSAAQVLEDAAVRLRRQGGRLMLVGLLPDPLALLERTGVAESIGEENLFPTQAGWFAAMDQALAEALTHDHHESDCPLVAYLRGKGAVHVEDSEVHRDPEPEGSTPRRNPEKTEP